VHGRHLIAAAAAVAAAACRCLVTLFENNKMKKSILALAMLGAAGAVSAQGNITNNVTIYGLLDLSVNSIHSDVASGGVTLDSGKWLGSRLGFKGSEDLGNGYSVEFKLENGFNGDTGSTGQGGRIFGRQSYIGLNGDFGALKVGRQWIPAYMALAAIDPLEVGMAGDASLWLGANVFDAIDVRTSNAINYAASSHGVSVVLSYGLGEVTGNASAERQIGYVLGYANGPFNGVLTQHTINDATGTGAARATILGATWNFGPVMAHLAFDVDKTTAAGATMYDRRNALLGVSVPLGAGKVRLDHIRQDDRLATNLDAHQTALAYTYDLSKRTTLYTSYAYASRDSATKLNAGVLHTF
jgi:predicted porin